jgi:hypothetical protein
MSLRTDAGIVAIRRSISAGVTTMSPAHWSSFCA